jgi:hypothetical protein
LGKKQPAATVTQPAVVALRGSDNFRDQEVAGLTRRNHGWLRYFTHGFSASAKQKGGARRKKLLLAPPFCMWNKSPSCPI